MPYGMDVALIHASAGMRRIVTLAYLLVWTWQEHVAACEHQHEDDLPAASFPPLWQRAL